VTSTIFRRSLLPGACALLLAACGGGDEDSSAAQAAATPAADSAAPAALPAPVTAPAAVPQPAAPADSATPNAAAPNAAAPRGNTSIAEQMLKAPVTGPVNVQALDNYTLTMERIRQLGRAGQSLGELQRRRPELRDSMRLEAFDPNAMYEKMNAIPDVREAIARVGMTPREYVTATAALTQAAAVSAMIRHGRTPTVEYNEANVRFVTEHWEEIQQLMRAFAAQATPQS
jgi:hypothetical protein